MSVEVGTKRFEKLLWWVGGMVMLVTVVGASVVFIAVAFRIELLDFDAPLTDEAQKALWTAAVGLLTVGATTIAAIATASYQSRTNAIKGRAEERERAVAAASLVGLLATESGVSPEPSLLGGVIATLLELGYIDIAHGVAESAVFEETLDAASTARTISRLLETDNSEAQVSAARMLRRSASRLTNQNTPDFEWPDAIYGKWETGLPRVARIHILVAIARIFSTSRSDRWTQRTSWALASLKAAIDLESDAELRTGASLIALALLEGVTEDRPVTLGDYRVDASELEKAARSVIAAYPAPVPSAVDTAVRELQTAWKVSDPRLDWVKPSLPRAARTP